MLKKTILSILVTLSAVLGCHAAGQWITYPLANKAYTQLVESPTRLYFVTANTLYHYDKNTQETYHYSIGNKLTGSLVQGIAYNPERKYLLVYYNDANMDVIFEDGRVVNLPEIKQVTSDNIPSIKTLNLVPGYICIATNFGYVIYDDATLTVRESRNLPGRDIRAVSVSKGYIVIQDGYIMRFAPMNAPRQNFEGFDYLSIDANRYQAIGDWFYWRENDNRVRGAVIDWKSGQRPAEIVDVASNFKTANWFVPSRSGYSLSTADGLNLFDATGAKTDRLNLGTDLNQGISSSWLGKSVVWSAGKQGVGSYDMTSGTPVAIDAPFHPQGAICMKVAFINQSLDGQRTYFTTTDFADLRTSLKQPYETFRYSLQKTDCLSNGVFTDVGATNKDEPNMYWNGRNRGDHNLVESPFDPSVYFMVATCDGVHVIKDKRNLITYDKSTFSKQPDWKGYIVDLGFDTFGNLMVYSGWEEKGSLSVLPAEKVKDYMNVTAADWRWFDIGKAPLYQGVLYDNTVLALKKSNVIALTTSRPKRSSLMLIDTQGKADWNVDRACSYSKFTDQDGNIFAPTAVMCTAEDLDGALWIGTTSGILELKSPGKDISPNLRFNRLKVPRNDGSGFADYLLDGEQVNAIAVDHANRKWIATQNSGLYLVSADGSEVIEHFTTGNSPLPTNSINVITADRLSNKIYIGTNYGPMAYESDAAPATEDLSNVSVYPNPVTPDYSGAVSITGLMDSSMVKITDAVGNLVHQSMSQGGMATWDVCNVNGERVRSGVYMIFATAGDNGQYNAVGKVVVVN